MPAVDSGGDKIDILVQKHKGKGAAVRLFKRLLKCSDIANLASNL
ncbi:hypothetical protein [Psychromonas ossibalaenae]